MGFFKKKKSEKQKELEDAISAYKMGQQFGGQLFAHVDEFAASRLDEVSVNLLEVFSGRLETVYDEPDHDPRTVAMVELKLFGEQVEKYRKTMAIEMIDDLPEAYVEAASSLNMDKELLDLIESVLEPRLQLLISGATKLLEYKLKEIEHRRRPQYGFFDKSCYPWKLGPCSPSP